MEPVPCRSDSPELIRKIYHLFREFFDVSEKKRRWNLQRDIPWDQVNPNLPGPVADIVETFCAVEMFLPDYLAKTIPQVRNNRGRAWFFANWGYEESKHSLALGDWLMKSRGRSEEWMTDLEQQVFSHEWEVPHDNPRAMACYTMTQELATWLHYVRLKEIVRAEGGDPALDRILQLVSIDERAHFDFFLKMVKIYLEDDREATLEQLRRVLNDFKMPAVHMLAGSRNRVEEVKRLRIFDYDIYYYEVFEPIIEKLGLTKKDLRRRTSSKSIAVMGGGPETRVGGASA